MLRKIPITIAIMDIVHWLVFYLEHDVSETGSSHRLRMEPTSLEWIDGASLSPEQIYLLVPNAEASPEDGDRILCPKFHVLI
jgi:hypothetical protein